jgi:adenylate cyclase
MGLGEQAMPGRWWTWGGAARPEVSAEFEHALMREVMRTELIRIKALIATAVVLGTALGTVYLLDLGAVQNFWHGRLKPQHFLIVLVPFVLFELWVYSAISRYLKLDRDVPAFRRYIGAFIETSIPTVALALHMESMGRNDALGYVVPLAYFIFIILSTLRLDFWLSAFTGLVASVELFAMAMFYHPLGDTDPAPEFWYNAPRSLVILVCGILAGTVGLQLRRQFAASIHAATARDRVTSLFGQHVSPQVVERLLLEGAGTNSDIRQVAVMFVDFRSFTAGARSRSPQDVVDRLDGAFAVLVEILDRHGGIVNKFLGDGFLALFGAPFEAEEPAHRAVAAAREMLVAMGRINRDSSWPLRIGIGIHFGEVVAGNIGSPRRKEYTVIGDTVNFASRLEALNKEFGSQLLISTAVREALGEDCGDAVALGEVPIRGYEQPMTVWQLG